MEKTISTRKNYRNTLKRRFGKTQLLEEFREDGRLSVFEKVYVIIIVDQSEKKSPRSRVYQ
jgi:hypothetical protein